MQKQLVLYRTERTLLKYFGGQNSTFYDDMLHCKFSVGSVKLWELNVFSFNLKIFQCNDQYKTLKVFKCEERTNRNNIKTLKRKEKYSKLKMKITIINSKENFTRIYQIFFYLTKHSSKKKTDIPRFRHCCVNDQISLFCSCWLWRSCRTV